jgi:hypothetical protein
MVVNIIAVKFSEAPLAEGMRQILSHDYVILSHQTAKAIKNWESSELCVV